MEKNNQRSFYMKKEAYVLLGYALFVMIGGMVGFAKAHSVPSLIAGTSFALLMAGSGIALLKNFPAGLYVGMAGSAVLTAFFAYRFLGSYKFMPAGMMFLLSAALFTFLVLLVCKCKACVSSK